MRAVGLLALLGFTLHNIIQRSHYDLSEMQSAVLMLLTLVGFSKIMSNVFPMTPAPKPRVIVKTVVSDSAVSDSAPSSVTADVPAWGTANTFTGNPDAGTSEYGRYGV